MKQRMTKKEKEKLKEWTNGDKWAYKKLPTYKT
jgi:hypothetical protein